MGYSPTPSPQNDFALNLWVLKKRGQPRNGLFYPPYTKRGLSNDVSYCVATVEALNGGSKLFFSSMFSHDVTAAMVFQTNPGAVEHFSYVNTSFSSNIFA